MIKELQRRLTFLYTVTTGIILTLVVISISFISQMNLMDRIDDDFQNHIMNVSTRLQSDNGFDITWLASMEAENGLIIHIEENRIPLLYHGSWEPAGGRDSLIGRARKQARLLETDLDQRPVSSPSISPVFTLQGLERDQYKGIAAAYPTVSGYKSLLLLYDITPSLKNLALQRLLFTLADISGIIALYFAARKLVQNALRPLQESSKKQQEFIAAASHELRSPLMVIQSSAQAIETVPEKTGQFTQNIFRECKRMGALVDDMLTLASFDSGSWSMHFENLDTNVLMIDFYELYEPLCLDKKTPFQLHIQEDMLPDIRGDRERIYQILSILMDNALSYNIDSRPVSLEAYADKAHITIKVIDHGPGIEDNKKELIFDRFYRADTSRKDKKHFGLGLSIARELALLHRGTLQAEDTPGGGSTFTFRMPALKCPSS